MDETFKIDDDLIEDLITFYNSGDILSPQERLELEKVLHRDCMLSYTIICNEGEYFMSLLNRNTEYISVKDLITGMVLAMDIVSTYGTELISKGSILNDHFIEVLQKLNYEEVLVYKSEVPQDEQLKSETHINNYVDKGYEVDKDKIKKLIQEVGNGNPLDVEYVEAVTGSIARQANTNLPLKILEKTISKDDYLYTHSLKVALLASLLGKWVGLDDKNVSLLAKTGVLHDIGKSKIDKNLLDKQGALTTKEYSLVKKHSEYGYEILKNIPDIEREVVLGVLMHHERFDGAGYPMAIKGEKISVFGKIVAIADVYAAMVSERPYAKKGCPFVIMDYLENECAEQFDLTYLRPFLYNIASSYIGNNVILSNGEKATVILVNSREFISKPMVKTEDSFVNLAKERDFKIVEVLPLLDS
ncbi:MAG: hypothetical protein APF76_02270 [Desulfitibacter sp. BRH_c19]|nr:MAG: hypothetical protein APF76_02270 [Desulfitibacter sp. BRH_c19]